MKAKLGPIWVRGKWLFINPIAVNLSATQASLTVSPIFPGQPVPIDWEFWSMLSQNLDLGSVVAIVYLDTGNVQLYVSPITPFPKSAISADTGVRHATIQPPPAGGTANDLFRFGAKLLRLDVAPKKTSQVFSDTASLQVVPEAVAGSWWEWTDSIGTPNPSAPEAQPMPFMVRHSFLINHSFTLVGRMHNYSQSSNSTMTGSATLLEIEFPEENHQSIEIESREFTVPPGGFQEIVFAPIKKNWTWLVQGVWVETGDRSKTFDYYVRFNMSDPFGNVYSDTMSFRQMIDIGVSDEKRGYASGALAALGLGIVAAIFTFGAGASAGTAIAAGLGAKALDPPEPSPHFRQEVQVRAGAKIKAPVKQLRLAGLARVLALADQSVVLLEALFETRDRLLGARSARNQSAVRLQSRVYRRIQRSLGTTVRRLVREAPDIAGALQADPDFEDAALETGLLALQRGGWPTDKRRQLAADGCSDETLNRLWQASQDQDVVALVRDVGYLLALLSGGLALVAREVRRGGSAVLKAQPRISSTNPRPTRHSGISPPLMRR